MIDGSIQSWIGMTSGAVALASFVPYIRSILRGQTRPNRASWIIWAFAEIITTATYAASGAGDTLWIAAGYSLGTVTVASLSLRYGEGGASPIDVMCLMGASIALIPWLVLDQAELALYMIIFVDVLAVFPTLKKAITDPDSEDKTYWSLSFLAAVINLFAINRWAPEIAAFPIYCFLGAGAIVLALYSRNIMRAVTARLRQPALPAPVPNLQS
jgi:pimeloyl-ACP methyl ester carboxylesterase